MADFKYNSTATSDPVGFNSKMGWGNVFERSYATPLDRTELFISYDDALAYAQQGNDSRSLSKTSYPGQVITVLNGATPTVYVIVGGSNYADGDDIPEGKAIGDENVSTRTLSQLGQQSTSGADIFWLGSSGSAL